VIRVRAPLTWKAAADLRGDTKKEFDDGSGEAVYRYRYPALKAAPSEPPVVLTLAPAVGVVHGRVRHFLRLAEAGWRLRSEVSVAPSRAEVDVLVIDVPDGFRLVDAEPREIVEEVVPDPPEDPNPRAYRVRLTAPRHTSFAFTLHGDYPAERSAAAVSLQLPRLHRVVARGSDVVVEVPAEIEVRGSLRAWEGDRLGSWDTPLEVDPADGSSKVRGAIEGFAGRVDLRWRHAAADARVAVTADVDVGPTRVLVSERLACRFPGRVPARIHLTASIPIADVRAGRGTVERAGDGWDLLPGEGDRESEFALNYAIPLPAVGGPGALPLLMPEFGATSRHVRVWAAPAVAVRLADPAGWRIVSTEVVPDRRTLPDLVLRADGPVGVPTVEIVPRAAGIEAGPVADEVHIEAHLGGTVAYRVHFRLGETATEVEIGLPAGARAVEVLVQGRRLPDTAIHLEDPPLVRLPPAVALGPFVVEMRYRLPASGRLEPPWLVRSEAVADVTWTVTPSPGRLVLRAGDTAGVWNLRALLAVLGVGRPGWKSESGPPLTVRRADLGPISASEVDRVPWVVGWSVGAAVCGLGLATARPRVRRVLGAGLLGAGFAAALTCPQPLAMALAAATPAAVGALVVWLGYRGVQYRYRRRLARAPGFARPGSSLVRPAAGRGGDSSPRSSSAIPTASAAAP
jgi:hypothetical protein